MLHITKILFHIFSEISWFNDVVWTNAKLLLCLSNLNQIMIQVIYIIMDLLLSYLNNYGKEYNKHKACNKNAHKIRVLFRLVTKLILLSTTYYGNLSYQASFKESCHHGGLQSFGGITLKYKSYITYVGELVGELHIFSNLLFNYLVKN